MSTKNVSKCSYYGKVLLDLTGDTVTASTLKKGATAHDATGTKITGTMTIPDSQAKTMDLNMASGDQVVKPDSGKVLSQVTVKKPSTFTAENIKKDVNIGGVVGTYAGSGSGGGGDDTKEYHIQVTNNCYNTIRIVSMTIGEIGDRYFSSGDSYRTVETYSATDIVTNLHVEVDVAGDTLDGKLVVSLYVENGVVNIDVDEM